MFVWLCLQGAGKTLNRITVGFCGPCLFEELDSISEFVSHIDCANVA